MEEKKDCTETSDKNEYRLFEDEPDVLGRGMLEEILSPETTYCDCQ